LLVSYEQFRDIANITDMDSPYQSAGMFLSETATRSTARRLRRTRQHLGSYRHDLIVAMRVVNNVEREILKAEWENWLLDENTRCKQVQMMIRESDRANAASNRRTEEAGSQQVLEAEAKERERSGRLKELKEWQEEYCGSCKLEQDRLLEGRTHIALGN
jgi:hypothetical protein